ncbi:MAG: NHL repeat-containing protein [Chloroflexi bacterium]|nr:NHL repeat-containing protein [Chloroflexota bacterium]
MATETRPRIGLKYRDTNGFGSAQGGRGYHLPVDIAVRSDGRIYVLSRGDTVPVGCGIDATDLDHSWSETFSSFGSDPGQMMSATAIAFDAADRLFMADESLQRITVFDADHNYECHWGAEGSGPGEFDGPSGIAFDRDSNLLVVDGKNQRVQRYTPDGKYISSFGSAGTGEGEFNLPWGVSVDSTGNIYVSDWRNDRIQRFAHNGEFIDAYGTSGRDEGQFDRPSNVAVDADGNIFVADWGNQRVQAFDKAWNFQTSIRGTGELSPWAAEYIDANADEKAARASFDPYPELDVDDPHEVSARTEPYFWDPVSLAMHGDNLLLVLETGRHRFQVWEKV